jgi:hypothetical protein
VALRALPSGLLSLLLGTGLVSVGVPVPGLAAASSSVVEAPVEAGRVVEAGSTGTGSAQETAAAQAAISGEPVEVLSERTPWSQVFARPDGLMEWHGYMEPRFALASDGSWADIDTGLMVGADGVVRPVATAVPVEFSGGGRGPMATIVEDGRSMSLWWPLGRLPAPRLAADTAVYPDVLPGVDLRLTASATGFSHALVVHTAQAAANPRLAELRFGVSGDVEVQVVNGGALRAVDPQGRVVFAAPTPVMWDSATGVDLAGLRLQRMLGEPASPPSQAARPTLSPIPVHTVGAGLVLVPDAGCRDAGRPADGVPGRHRPGLDRRSAQRRVDDGVVEVPRQLVLEGRHRLAERFDKGHRGGGEGPGLRHLLRLHHPIVLPDEHRAVPRHRLHDSLGHVPDRAAVVVDVQPRV